MRGGTSPSADPVLLSAVCQPALRNADRPKAEMLRSAGAESPVPLQFGGSIYVFNHRIRNLYPLLRPCCGCFTT